MDEGQIPLNSFVFGILGEIITNGMVLGVTSESDALKVRNSFYIIPTEILNLVLIFFQVTRMEFSRSNDESSDGIYK